MSQHPPSPPIGLSNPAADPLAPTRHSPAAHADDDSHPTDATAPRKEQIHTHHCLCTHLLLATTYDLASLPRRKRTRDGALVLPVPQHARPRGANDDAPESESESDGQSPSDSEAPQRRQRKSRRVRGGFTLLSGATRSQPSTGHVRKEKGRGREREREKDAPPVVLRLEDGFEKRWLVRCGRCRLVVGYDLGWGQFQEGGDGGGGENDQMSDISNARREDVVYILPGAMVSTENMRKGKMPEGGEVDFGGVGNVPAAIG